MVDTALVSLAAARARQGIYFVRKGIPSNPPPPKKKTKTNFRLKQIPCKTSDHMGVKWGGGVTARARLFFVTPIFCLPPLKHGEKK